MRFRHRDGTLVHLAYGSNVHPAEDLDGILAQLERFARPTRERLGVGLLGIELWLAHGVAGALRADEAARTLLRTHLDALGLEVVSLNGFPYAGFHRPVVKTAVYRPDWTERARLRHTVTLAWVLAGLLPAGVARGSVSTLPLGWRAGFTDAHLVAARAQLAELAAELAAVEAATGRRIRVAVEPEPGCVVETTAQATAVLAGLDPDRVGLCLDTCHLAVAHEDSVLTGGGPEGTGAVGGGLTPSWPPIVKAQLSAGLLVRDPRDPEARRVLASYLEPRFLHQTREPGTDGTDDLDEALATLPGERPWRVHFHIPVHADPPPPLASTRPVLEAALAALLGGPVAATDHLAVETYTWNALPPGRRPRDDAGLVAGIAAELAWARDALLSLGLEEEPT